MPTEAILGVVEEDDRFGIVLAGDAGVETVYVLRNVHDRVLEILHRPRQVVEDSRDLSVGADFADAEIPQRARVDAGA
jgi:hypothetical protein